MKRTPTISLAKLDRLKRDGKIRGYTIPEGIKSQKKRENKIGGRIVTKFFPTKSKEKNSIVITLIEFCQKRNLELQEEYFFHVERRWRFDWCIPEIKVAIEYNGIISEKSRHTTVGGYSGDMDKLNAAQALDWRVIQLTPLNYKSLIDEFQNIRFLRLPLNS